jgi:hypothetical protein
MIEELEAALAAEFDGEVIFAPWLPPTLLPPAVYVVPLEDWIVPSTHGGVGESWEISVAVSAQEPRTITLEARALALRVRTVCLSLGVHWLRTTRPRPAGNAQTVVSTTEITFRYLPNEE